jgi:hypothetical protein
MRAPNLKHNLTKDELEEVLEKALRGGAESTDRKYRELDDPSIPPPTNHRENAIASSEFLQPVFVSQPLSFIGRKRCHVGFPSGTPVGMPSPQSAQKRPWVAVIFRAETTCFALVLGHPNSPSDPTLTGHINVQSFRQSFQHRLSLEASMP